MFHAEVLRKVCQDSLCYFYETPTESMLFNDIDSFVTARRNDLVSQNKVESPVHHIYNQEKQRKQ